nr:hypothetical protein OH826_38695 [Streptomyces sp. NBC_00899]
MRKSLSTPLPPGQYRDGGRLAAITVAMLCVVLAGDMASVLIQRPRGVP